MFNMTVEGSFNAAHAIREYPGPCCRLHGHTFRVVVRLAGSELDKLGMLIDFTEVKSALAKALEPLDHAYLNEVPPFSTENPTSEALARYLFQQMQSLLLTTEDRQRRIRLVEVIVYESPTQSVGYGEGTDANL